MTILCDIIRLLGTLVSISIGVVAMIQGDHTKSAAYTALGLGILSTVKDRK